MHLGGHHAGMAAGADVGRPQSGGRKLLGQIFEDGERFPDVGVAIDQHRHLAGQWWQSRYPGSSQSRVEGLNASGHHAAMPALTLPDILALAWFVGAWIVYSVVVEKTTKGRSSLNFLMHSYRDDWMEQLIGREMRMVDAQVTAALQNGTAFFASTSLIAIGGALTLMRASDDIFPVVSLINLGSIPSRQLWEFKVLGLIVIFI